MASAVRLLRILAGGGVPGGTLRPGKPEENPERPRQRRGNQPGDRDLLGPVGKNRNGLCRLCARARRTTRPGAGVCEAPARPAGARPAGLGGKTSQKLLRPDRAGGKTPSGKKISECPDARGNAVRALSRPYWTGQRPRAS